MGPFRPESMNAQILGSYLPPKLAVENRGLCSGLCNQPDHGCCALRTLREGGNIALNYVTARFKQSKPPKAFPILNATT